MRRKDLPAAQLTFSSKGQLANMAEKQGRVLCGAPGGGKDVECCILYEKALSEDEITWSYMVRLRELTLTKEGGRDGRSRLKS